MAVNIALPLNEVDAAPEARAVFAEAREALRTPFTPGLIRSLAQWPAYLAYVWEQLRPSIETAGFRGSAQYLAAMAREAVDQFYEATYARNTLLDSGLSEFDIETIAGGLEVLHLTNPQCLLIAGALTEALERPRVGGMGRPEPRDISEEERRILAYEWRMLDEGEMSADMRRLAADVREVLGLPFL
ncbi:MAG TPA: halocarboxylic acid dehydrogenase DehI family protein, partial [Dehalococcoidia bacterium]|nr:halocarboxylic acid dehydrogenase DehI family protein [Dehalococcoidia bacterium]